MKESRELVKHGGILFVAGAVAGVCNYFFHVYMVRSLGPEEYGILYTLSAILIFIAIPMSAMQMVMARYVSLFCSLSQYGKIRFLFFRVLKKVLFYVLPALILLMIFSPSAARFLKIELSLQIVFTGFILFVVLLSPSALGVLQGLQRFVLLGSSFVLGAVLRVGFGIFLVRRGLGVSGALGAYFIASLIAFLAVFFPLLFSLKKHPVDSEIPRAQIYSYLGPVLTALACFSVLSYVDVIFVKHHFSALSAGYYSTAALIGKTFLFIPMAFSYAMFPKVSQLHARGEDSYALFKRTFGISFFTLAAGIVFCLAFPKPIAALLIKEKDLTPLALNTIIPLIRTFGLAMSPFALLSVIIHYNLARHRLSFVRFLLAGVAIHIILLTLFHNTLMQVVFVLFTSGVLMFLCQQHLILRERKNKKME